MRSRSRQRVFVSISVAVTCGACVVLAVAAPPPKTSLGDFAGTKAGQVRSDNGLKTEKGTGAFVGVCFIAAGVSTFGA